MFNLGPGLPLFTRSAGGNTVRAPTWRSSSRGAAHCWGFCGEISSTSEARAARGMRGFRLQNSLDSLVAIIYIRCSICSVYMFSCSDKFYRVYKELMFQCSANLNNIYKRDFRCYSEAH